MPNPLAYYQRQAARARQWRNSEPSIDFMFQLQRWAAAHQLPPNLADLRLDRIYAVPLPVTVDGEHIIVLIGSVQVHWLLQLTGYHHRWALHVDGKFNLHDGGWVLLTCGTHCPQWRTSADGKQHSPGNVQGFFPLVYCLSEGIETTASVLYAFQSMELVVRM